jgi:glycogen(starch) synthase
MAADGRRVLMTADTVGGVWQYALELSRALIARGDEVVLATFGGMPSAAQHREAAAIPGLTLLPSDLKLAWMCAPWDDLARGAEWLATLSDQVRPDVVHLNDFSHGDLAWDAPVLMVAHSCVLSWWQAVHGTAAPGTWDRYAAHVRASLRAADLVVAPTAAMLDAACRHYGPLRHTRVIHNGRSQPAPAAGTAVDEAPMILAAGRVWDSAKNLGALASVAPRLSWPVVIAGADRSPDGDRIELPNVRLLGQLSSEELAPWFARAPVYALPARYEPFGLTALEAALSGCALVLGDIDSLREVWGDAAIFVPPDDEDALAAALQALIDDPELRARQAARARARAARYTPDAMADGYRDAYSALIAAHAARGAAAPALAAAAGGAR